MRHPGLLPNIKGGAYIASFAMCAMRSSKHAGILKPEAAHMPQNGMYAPPRAATDNRGWRIHRVFCDVCDEGLQARRPSKTGGRTHATKRHVCATHRRRAHLKKGQGQGKPYPYFMV